MTWRKNPLRIFLVGNWHIKIASLIVAVFLVYLNTISGLEERTLMIPLDTRLTTAQIPANHVPTHVQVALRGERSEIVDISAEDVYAFIDLTPYENAGLYDVAVQIERRNIALNVDPLTINVQPTHLSVRLEGLVEKHVTVVVDTQGEVAAGYQLANISVVPQTVGVSGPQSVLEQLDEVSTQSINIANQETSSSTRVPLIAPSAHVQFTGQESVNVVFDVREVVVVRNIENVQIEITNLPRRLVANYDLENAVIIVRSVPSYLNQLTTRNVSLVLDIDRPNAVPGEHSFSLTPRIFLPLQEFVEVVDFYPKFLAVTLERR